MKDAFSFASDETFDHEIASTPELGILLDFTADWCEPCNAMEPILRQVAAHFAHQMRVVRIDFDECPKVTERFHVLSIPTLILFRNGEVVRRLRGAQSRSALVGMLEESLGGG